MTNGERIRDTLWQLCNEAGPFLGAGYALFEGDPDLVMAIGLRFESWVGVFRAVPADDTLAIDIGPLVPELHEVIVAAGPPWLACAGLRAQWAWSLTNQQGYTDGVRLEFDSPDGTSRVIVEMIVVASAIRLFVASEA